MPFSLVGSQYTKLQPASYKFTFKSTEQPHQKCSKCEIRVPILVAEPKSEAKRSPLPPPPSVYYQQQYHSGGQGILPQQKMVDNVCKWLADCSFENDQYNQWQRIERDIDSLLLENDASNTIVAAASELWLTPNMRYVMSLTDKEYFQWRIREWTIKQRVHTHLQMEEQRQERAFFADEQKMRQKGSKKKYQALSGFSMGRTNHPLAKGAKKLACNLLEQQLTKSVRKYRHGDVGAKLSKTPSMVTNRRAEKRRRRESSYSSSDGVLLTPMAKRSRNSPSKEKNMAKKAQRAAVLLGSKAKETYKVLKANPPGLSGAVNLGFWEMRMALLPSSGICGGGKKAIKQSAAATTPLPRITGNSVEFIEGRGVLISYEQFEQFSAMAEELARERSKNSSTTEVTPRKIRFNPDSGAEADESDEDFLGPIPAIRRVKNVESRLMQQLGNSPHPRLQQLKK